MKKLNILFFALLLLAKTATGQTTATDFTATDCNGTSHNLFTELGQGKVVVLVWVMPCATCINDAKGAHEAVQSFATSHPGKVVYYMVDDNGGTSCASLTGWANTNNIKQDVTFFRNQGVEINEDDYGGPGMPHVVVIGLDKKIYFNVRNGQNNRTAIQDAISKALTTVSVAEIPAMSGNVSVYPNPGQNNITASFTLQAATEVNFEVYNALGEKVLSQTKGTQPAGAQQLNIDVNPMINGIYFLKITTGEQTFLTRFIVAK
jgi:hypothetical protein